MIDEDSISFLKWPIDEAEIKITVFSIKSLKGPGVDGLHVIFYQSQWGGCGWQFFLSVCYEHPRYGQRSSRD